MSFAYQLVNTTDEEFATGIQSFDEQLLRYMKERNNFKAKEILKNYKPGGLIDRSKSTLLHYTAKYGNNLTNYLVNAGCNVNAQDDLGKTPLVYAVEENHELTVKDLLACDANLYIRDKQQRSALQMACNSKICLSLNILKMCIEKVSENYRADNAEIANKLIEANCPLYFAMYARNGTVTKILVDHGIPVNSHDPTTGETALHVAAKLTDVENVKMLVECGADVNATDRLGRKPFFSINVMKNEDEDLEILKILLNRELILTSLNYKGQMQAHYLIELGGSLEEQIFNYDVDFTAKDAEGNTIMHYLAADSSKNLENLVGKKLDVNACNKDGNTALQLAFMRNKKELVGFLLDNGAKIDHADDILLNRLTSEWKSVDLLDSVRVLMRYDEGINFISKHREKIGECFLYRNDSVSKLMLALLAMFDASEMPISDNILSIVNYNAPFISIYESYKKELAIMKEKVVYNSVTLFNLLTDDQNKIEMYVRSQDLVENYAVLEYDFSPDSYFIDVLENRVRKPMHLAKLKNTAMYAFCKLVGLNINAGYVIVNNIFSYLDKIDLKNLVNAF